MYLGTRSFFSGELHIHVIILRILLLLYPFSISDLHPEQLS